jgi:hypothetical protein
VVTLADLQAYVGAPARRGAYYLEHRGGLDITAWEDTLAGSVGWWYAITRLYGDQEILVALGWSAGGLVARTQSIAVALAVYADADPDADLGQRAS